ncbi:MAG: toluene hydroxylase [Solirubrobacterales bacterium]|nr:toluene hydroxylase [Solirubrobacterales bacterium]
MSQSRVAASRGVRTGVPSGTALACADWQAFSGPGGRWVRSIERMESEAEARVTAAISRVTRGETFSDVSPAWVRFLQENMPVAAFAFNECGRLLQALSLRSPWGGLSDGLALQASMQHRQAQAIVLYIADMEQRLDTLPMPTARTRWRTDRSWLPTHHFLEQATTSPDWGEALVAINLCFEPLAGQLLRREFAMRLGPAHGDQVTGIVAETGQDEWALIRTWTAHLITFLVQDEEHGEENQALLQTWVARQLPAAEQAARALAGLVRDLDSHAAGSVARVVEDQRAFLGEVGLVAA